MRLGAEQVVSESADPPSLKNLRGLLTMRRITPTIAASALCLVSVLGLAACGSEKPTDSDKSPSMEQTMKGDDKDKMMDDKDKDKMDDKGDKDKMMDDKDKGDKKN